VFPLLAFLLSIANRKSMIICEGFCPPCTIFHSRSPKNSPRLARFDISSKKYSSSFENPPPLPPQDSKPAELFAAKPAIDEFFEVNVRYNDRNKLIYDEAADQFKLCPVTTSVSPESENKFLKSLFLPEGVTPDYYRFVKWRILQRYLSAIIHVIGTRSLLLGLTNSASPSAANAARAAKGGSILRRAATSSSHAASTASKGLSVAAAVNWILKDALGKLVRMAWAGKMGRKFDSDAKRWRFRGALMYGVGNCLEIVCWLNPSLFLVWATLANCLKQMSMLTSSSTRNALYNSFMGGGRENIGDITAKGEAQIAVVDLFGILTGVFVAKMVGTEVRLVFGVYALLQVAEIFCMYHEIRSVVFKLLNFERLWKIVNNVVGVENMIDQQKTPSAADADEGDDSDLDLEKELSREGEISIPNPYKMSLIEKVFLPPSHFCRRAIAFGSLGRAKLSPKELQTLLDIFSDDRYLLVVGEDVKNKRHNRKIRRVKRGFRRFNKPRNSFESGYQDSEEIYGDDGIIDSSSELIASAQEDCHIVLHASATNLDIVKATIALACLRRELGRICGNGYSDECEVSLTSRRTEDSYELIRDAKKEADELFPIFLTKLKEQGWSINRFMFGRVSMRNDWKLSTHDEWKLRSN